MAVLIQDRNGNYDDVGMWHPCPDSLMTVVDSASYYFAASVAGKAFAWTPSSGYDMLGVWVESWYNQAPAPGTVITVSLQENVPGWTTRASGTYTLTNEGYSEGFFIRFTSPFPVTAVAAHWQLLFQVDAGTYNLGVTGSVATLLRYAMVANHNQIPATGDVGLIDNVLTINGDYSAVNWNSFRIGYNGVINGDVNNTGYLKGNTAISYLMGGDIILGQDGAPIPANYNATVDLNSIYIRGYHSSLIAKGTKKWSSFRSKLAASVAAVSSSITTDDATAWSGGEQVFLCATGSTDAGDTASTEDLETIDTVSGTLVTFTSTTSYGHYAAGDYKCDAVNVTRNTRLINSALGYCTIALSVGRIYEVDLYCAEVWGVLSTANPAYNITLEEVAWRGGTQTAVFFLDYSVDARVYVKNSILYNFNSVTLGGHSFYFDNSFLCDVSTTSSSSLYFYWHGTFRDCVISGIVGYIYLYAYLMDYFEDCEFYANSSSASTQTLFLPTFYQDWEALRCKFWKNHYPIIYLFASTYTGSMTFNACKFAGNSGSGDFFNSLVSTYNGIIIIKGGTTFDGWAGRTCSHVFQGSFGNLLVESGTKFGYTIPYQDRYFRFTVGTEANFHDIWTSNYGLYGDGNGLGIEDYVAFQGVNNDDNFVRAYSNGGSYTERDISVYYGNSGHSLKIVPYTGYGGFYFAWVRFWVPCTANEKVTIRFRCRKSASIFTYYGPISKYVYPTATLRGLGQFEDVVVEADTPDTNWNLVTLEATPTKTGSLILDIKHCDTGGQPIWVDAFEVLYG